MSKPILNRIKPWYKAYLSRQLKKKLSIKGHKSVYETKTSLYGRTLYYRDTSLCHCVPWSRRLKQSTALIPKVDVGIRVQPPPRHIPEEDPQINGREIHKNSTLVVFSFCHVSSWPSSTEYIQNTNKALNSTSEQPSRQSAGGSSQRVAKFWASLKAVNYELLSQDNATQYKTIMSVLLTAVSWRNKGQHYVTASSSRMHVKSIHIVKEVAMVVSNGQTQLSALSVQYTANIVMQISKTTTLYMSSQEQFLKLPILTVWNH